MDSSHSSFRLPDWDLRDESGLRWNELDSFSEIGNEKDLDDAEREDQGACFSLSH